MPPLFPEPEAYSPFPPGMPPQLAQGAMPIWQIDRNYMRGKRDHEYTRYPYFFAYKHALYVLRQLIDLQLHALVELRVLTHLGSGRWAYEASHLGHHWKLTPEPRAPMTEFALSMQSLYTGLNVLESWRLSLDTSRDASRFELLLREFYDLDDIPDYDLFWPGEQ